MSHTKVNVSWHCFWGLSFRAERHSSVYCPHTRGSRFFTDVDAIGNSHGLDTIWSTSSQVPARTTSHTNRF